MNKEFDMLDKDIKILREFTESSCHLYSQEEIIEATKNVLLELEKKDEEIEISDQLIERQNIEIDNLKSDLETWKKIAEKLAKNTVRAKCERCVEDLNEDGCARCTIDWARKEVENEKR